jgi:arylsulfatase A-like enzyme
LISIDCLRADHVGAYGYERNTTPRIDVFADEAVLFETAVSTAPMTPPSHMSMFTGLFPSLHDGSKFAKLALSVPYVPKILSQAGYQTDALVTGAYLSQTYGFERGFHLYRLDHRSPAAATVDQAIELLRLSSGRNQFLFVHLIDAHWPYQPPEKLIERFHPRPPDLAELNQKIVNNEPPSTPEEIDRVVALYDSEIASADEALGQLLDEMKIMGLYDRSLIILTADHGEAFYDHGHWQHSRTLYEELVRIPLIVKWPGQSPKGRVRSQVSQVDIFTTVLTSAGLSPPPSDGIDLLEFVSGTAEATKRRRVISENAWRSPNGWARKISIRTEKQKYIVTLAGAPGIEPTESDLQSEELYDLIQDPNERNDLLAESSSGSEPFRRELGNYLSRARKLRASRRAESIVEDPTTRERLKSLGYIN